MNWSARRLCHVLDKKSWKKRNFGWTIIKVRYSASNNKTVMNNFLSFLVMDVVLFSFRITETYLAFCNCKNIIKLAKMQKACTQSNFASVSRPHAVTPPWIRKNNGLYKTVLWSCSLIEMKHKVKRHIFYKPDISMPTKAISKVDSTLLLWSMIIDRCLVNNLPVNIHFFFIFLLRF